MSPIQFLARLCAPIQPLGATCPGSRAILGVREAGHAGCAAPEVSSAQRIATSCVIAHDTDEGQKPGRLRAAMLARDRHQRTLRGARIAEGYMLSSVRGDRKGGARRPCGCARYRGDQFCWQEPRPPKNGVAAAWLNITPRASRTRAGVGCFGLALRRRCSTKGVHVILLRAFSATVRVNAGTDGVYHGGRCQEPLACGVAT